MTAPDLSVWEGILRLLLAFGLAGIVGLEREFKDQEAGLRTHILVGVGACLFVLIGAYGWQEIPVDGAAGISYDPARIVSYVVTGVGFLGAGAILKEGINVTGLTTAASLWVSAALGVASGAGEYYWALAGGVVVLISLWPLNQLDRLLKGHRRNKHRLHVVIEPSGRVTEIADAIEAAGGRIAAMTVEENEEQRDLDVVVVADAGMPRVLDSVLATDAVRSAMVAD